ADQREQQQHLDHQREPRQHQCRQIDAGETGHDAPYRSYGPVGQRDDELAQRIAEGRAAGLHEKAQHHQVDEQTDQGLDEKAADLSEHGVSGLYCEGRRRAVSTRPRSTPGIQSLPSSLPSSAARARAASMARTIASATACCCSVASARSVVPPLDVTRSRSSETGSSERAASSVAPRKVSSTSARAASASSPASTAARCIASMK